MITRNEIAATACIAVVLALTVACMGQIPMGPPLDAATDTAAPTPIPAGLTLQIAGHWYEGVWYERTCDPATGILCYARGTLWSCVEGGRTCP